MQDWPQGRALYYGFLGHRDSSSDKTSQRVKGSDWNKAGAQLGGPAIWENAFDCWRAWLRGRQAETVALRLFYSPGLEGFLS